MTDFRIATQAIAKNDVFPIVMLHGSAMGPDSWTGLREHLGPGFDVTAPDLPGFARTDGRVDATPASLDEIADRLAEEIGCPDHPVHLVGHDLGAVLGLKIAAAYPARVASLTLIEPTAFNTADSACAADRRLADEVAATLTTINSLLARGDQAAAMQTFIDFINGPGTWARTSARHRNVLTRNARASLAELRAIAADRMTPADLAGVVCPVLQIRGGATQPKLRQMARSLRVSVPFLQDVTIDGAAHFPHLSDPHRVDPLIVDFLVRVDRQWQDTRETLRIAA